MSKHNTNSEEDPPNLDELRVKIDALKSSLVSLLNERAEVVVKIGKAKQHDGSPIYAPDRESSVLKIRTMILFPRRVSKAPSLPLLSVRLLSRQLASIRKLLNFEA